MWNAPKNTIASADIALEHWRVLTAALRDIEECDPRSRQVSEALDYFRARTIRQGAINLIAAGLRDGNSEYVRAGHALLRKHLGGVIRSR